MFYLCHLYIKPCLNSNGIRCFLPSLMAIFSKSLLTQENNETGLLLEGNDLSPALNKGMTWANFQSNGKIF